MKKEQPLVSVVISSYCHERYVRDTIMSVVNQTYENIELLVLDDGSKDRTYAIVEELRPICEKRFKRCWFKTHTNVGTSATLQELVNESRGAYVAAIASDDQYFPEALERMVEALSAPGNADAVVAVGQNYIMDGDGRQCYWDVKRNIVYESDPKIAYRTFNEFIGDYMKAHHCDVDRDFGTFRLFLTCGNHIANGALIRREAIVRVKATPKAPLEDWWLMSRLSMMGRFLNLPVPTFRYRWHADNTVKREAYFRRIREMTKAHMTADFIAMPLSEKQRLNVADLPRKFYFGSDKWPIALYRYRFSRYQIILRIGRHRWVFAKRIK